MLIAAGELDHVPEQAFFFMGTIEEVLEHAERLKAFEQQRAKVKGAVTRIIVAAKRQPDAGNGQVPMRRASGGAGVPAPSLPTTDRGRE